MRFVKIGRRYVNLEHVTEVYANDNPDLGVVVTYDYADSDDSYNWFRLTGREADRFLAALDEIGNVHTA